MIRVREAIVVEGRYDRNTLAQIVDAPVFETAGFSVMHNRALLGLLRRAAEKRGLIILTDSDGAGFVIRNYLKGAIPKGRVLHAYIPDVYGRERRKRAPGREGKIGVEGMDKQTILDALRAAGATFEGETAEPSGERLTKRDLYELGLSGGRDSAARRAALQHALRLPEHLGTNALLDALNLIFTREEFFAYIQRSHP